MNNPLNKRLSALEALPPKVDPEHDRLFHAAIKAMFDTVPHAGEWAPSKTPPFNWVEQPSELELLSERIKTNATTDADDAIMAAWPKCHLRPALLVEALARLKNIV